MIMKYNEYRSQNKNQKVLTKDENMKCPQTSGLEDQGVNWSIRVAAYRGPVNHAATL